PPIFVPQFDPTVVTPGVVKLFGSADAPLTVLRVATRRGRCMGGSLNGTACTVDADCGTAPCADACAGGANHALACAPATDCPGGLCGTIIDTSLLAAATSGGGPLAVPRFGAGVCQQPPHAACADDAACGGSDRCVTYAFTAENPVPLDGLTGSTALFSFV